MRAETPQLSSQRLRLSPLAVTDAAEMVSVLADQSLYSFTGGEPPSLVQLIARYELQVGGPSRGDEVWHNWIIRLESSGRAIGFVQATVTSESTDLAWVVGVRWQRNGFATEAALAMTAWLARNGTERFTAHIHPGHQASHHVAAAIGLGPTTDIDGDGEVIWSSGPS